MIATAFGYEDDTIDLDVSSIPADMARAWVAQRNATLEEFDRRNIDPKNTPTWTLVNKLADAFKDALLDVGNEEE